jgi:hypothetical protein
LNSNEFFWQAWLSHHRYIPIPKLILINKVFSSLAWVKNGLTMKNDPLTKSGAKKIVLNPSGNGPFRRGELADSRLRIPHGRQVPVLASDGFEKSTQLLRGTHPGFVEIRPVSGHFVVTAASEHGRRGDRASHPLLLWNVVHRLASKHPEHEAALRGRVSQQYPGNHGERKAKLFFCQADGVTFMLSEP